MSKPTNIGAFLRNGGRVIVGESKIAPIDRSKPFNPANFIGEGWTIEEEDERSLALTEVDLTSTRLEHMLKQGERRGSRARKSLCVSKMPVTSALTLGYSRLSGRISISSRKTGRRRRTATQPPSTSMGPFFGARAAAASSCACTGTMASGTGITTGSASSGASAARRSSSQVSTQDSVPRIF